MSTDALAPCITRPSVTMVLITQDKWVLVFHEEGSQLFEPSQCEEIWKMQIYIFMFPEMNSVWKKWLHSGLVMPNVLSAPQGLHIKTSAAIKIKF